MIVRVPGVLDGERLARVRSLIEAGPWQDGRATAGPQSAAVKNNRQLQEGSSACTGARRIVQEALAREAMFFTAALPRRLVPPLFNRYDGATNDFGNHVDNAIRGIAPGESVRTDLSATLFLSAPDDYDGGELIVEDTYGTHAVKLAAGDLVLYPASSLHRVQPVTRGTRLASFFWIESMVREDDRRRLLYDLDLSIMALRTRHGESAEAVRLTSCYHNLLRMWATP